MPAEKRTRFEPDRTEGIGEVGFQLVDTAVFAALSSEAPCLRVFPSIRQLEIGNWQSPPFDNSLRPFAACARFPCLSESGGHTEGEAPALSARFSQIK